MKGCLLLFFSALCLRLLESFRPYQQTFHLLSSIRPRVAFTSLPKLNAKGFGKSNNEGAAENSDNIDDILLQTIAAKEAEFQAELDKMLAEAKESNALSGKNSLDDFSNEDLSKAIMEMQKLRKQQCANGGVVENDVTMSEDGFQIVKLVIPPGLRPGEMMVVQLRNGMFEIEVPEGVQEGDEIEVELPT